MAIIAWGASAPPGLRAGRKAEPDASNPDRQGHQGQADHQGSGLSADRRVMTGVVDFITTFGACPSLTARAGRRCSIRSASTTMLSPPAFRCRPVCRGVGRRGRAQGLLSLQDGCKGPTTYNACSTVRWNGGVSFPIQSGMAASAARKTGSGTRARSTTGSPRSTSSVSRPMPTRSAARPQASSAPASFAHAAITAVKRVTTKREKTDA